MRRKINGIYFTGGEMDAIFRGLDRSESNLETCILAYNRPEHARMRRQWRRQLERTKTVREKFWRVSIGLPMKE